MPPKRLARTKPAVSNLNLAHSTLKFNNLALGMSLRRELRGNHHALLLLQELQRRDCPVDVMYMMVVAMDIFGPDSPLVYDINLVITKAVKEITRRHNFDFELGQMFANVSAFQKRQ